MSTTLQTWTLADVQPKEKPPQAIAYCYKSGEIKISRKRGHSKGTIVFAQGSEHQLRKWIGVLCRWSHDNKTMLVPGLPEVRLTKKDPVEVVFTFERAVKDRMWRAKRKLKA